MRDQIRSYVEAGRDALSPAKAKDMARSMVSGEGKERITRLAQDLVDWSNKSRDRVTELIRSEVRKQLQNAGVVTRDDFDTLRKRVRDLEKARTPGAATGRASTSRASSSSKPSAKRSAKTPARRPAAKRSSATRTPAPG